MQALLDQTAEMSANFEARAAAATAEVADSQARMIEAFSARDKQLQEHIDTAQRNNILSLELLKGQLSDSEQKKFELLATVEARLQPTCQKLCDQELADARASFGESRSSGERAEQAFGK